MHAAYPPTARRWSATCRSLLPASPVRPQSAGADFSCALLSTGAGLVLGRQHVRELGRGTFGGNAPTADTVMGLTDATRITASYQHACAIRTDGTAVCRGENSDDGRLGNGGARLSLTPISVVWDAAP